jgi:hypothetical protein
MFVCAAIVICGLIQLPITNNNIIMYIHHPYSHALHYYCDTIILHNRLTLMHAIQCHV